MKVAVIGGVMDSKSFLIAVHVAVLGREKFPAFEYRTRPVDKHDYQKWLATLCEDEQWPLTELQKERVVCWYEVGPGGPRRLLGGLHQFLEYMYHNFGVQRQLTFDQLETLLRLRKKQMKADSDYDDKMTKLKNRLTVSLIGAGSNSAVRMLIYGILRLKGRQLQDEILIRLYDKHESNQEKLKKIQSELNYLENSLGSGFITIVTNFKQLVQGCDLLIFLGENFRRAGMDVEEFLHKERVLYSVYGVLSNRYVEYNTKIVFCCMENSCFNATAFLERLPSLSPGRVVAITQHLSAQLKVYISKVAGFPIQNIVDIPVWGMAEMCHVVDPSKGRILFRYPDTKSDWFPSYESFAEKCGPAMKLFCRMMERKRQEKQEAEDPVSQAKDREEVKTALMDWAKSLEKEARKGSSEASALLQRVREQLAELLDGGLVDFALSLRSLAQGSVLLYDKKWLKKHAKEELSRGFIKESIRRYFNEKEVDGEGSGEDEELGVMTYGKEVKENNTEDKDEIGCKATKEAVKRLTSEEFKIKCGEWKDSSEDEELKQESSACSKVREERYEVRQLGYITGPMKNLWSFLGVAKRRVRVDCGEDPFLAEIHELTELLKVWFLDPCRKNQILYLGIQSDGSYGFPRGYVMSQPARLDEKQCWQPYLEEEAVQPTPVPHQDPPSRLSSSLPQPYSLQAMVSVARTTLKHFSIKPEVETIEDIVAKRLLKKNIINWRLEKMEADYEYRELKILNLNEPAKSEVKPFWEMFEEAIEGKSDVFARSRSVQEELSEEAGMAEEGKDWSWEEESCREEEGDMPKDRRKIEEEAKEDTARDRIHTDYLTSLGFYDVTGSDEELVDPEDLDSHFQQLIKDALKEYFGYVEDEEGDKLEDKGEGMSGSRESRNLLWEEGEFAAERFHQFEDYKSEKTDKSVAAPAQAQITIQRGIGMDLHIEDEFGYSGFRSDVLSDSSSKGSSLYPEKHEYEKKFTAKPGFPLEMQGKSTIDIYKELLQADPSLLRDTFVRLAEKVDSRYAEEVGKGTIIEEDDGSVVIGGSSFNLCKSMSEDSRSAQKKVDKLSSNKNNKERAQEIWSKREADDTGLQRDNCKLQKGLSLGVVTRKDTETVVTLNKGENEESSNKDKREVSEDEREREEERRGSEMNEEELMRLQRLRDELWQMYTTSREQLIQPAHGPSVKLKDYEKGLFRTEEELKKECTGFREMIELYREEAWRGGEYFGDERPDWSFPAKLSGQHYRDYKNQALITRLLMFAALEEQKKEELSSLKHSFLDSSSEDASQKSSP